MKRFVHLILLLIIVVAAKYRSDDYALTVPPKWPLPVYDFSTNPLNDKKTKLGRILFYDTQLSRDNSISCASCHSPYTAFAHTDHKLSHGIDDKIGIRNAPVLINLAWQKSFMWDGAIHHLDMQALSPVNNPIEMDEQTDHLINKLQHTTLYPPLFYEAFGDSIITGEHFLKAMSSFLLTLVSANSRYDSVMRGETKFNEQENHGYQLFRQHCASCHTEPLFTNGTFESNGLSPDSVLKDGGRIRITHVPSDSMKFKVPTLRNIEFSYPYMHDGRFQHLNEVLNHYSQLKTGTLFLSSKVKVPLNLHANDKVDLMAFLLSLSDRHFLYNKSYGFPSELLPAKK